MQDMSTATTLVIESHSLDDTLQIGESIGRNLKGGETIELISDLGGGKTALVRGIARGMDSPDSVASPTFTISREYRSPRGFTMHHYDFYRLSDPGVLRGQLSESLEDDQVVTAIEWSNVVNDLLPNDRLTIALSSTGEEGRKLELSAKPEHTHLLKGLNP